MQIYTDICRYPQILYTYIHTYRHIQINTSIYTDICKYIQIDADRYTDTHRYIQIYTDRFC